MSLEKPEEKEGVIKENNEDMNNDENKKEEGGEGKIPTPLEKSREDTEWWREQK